MFKIGFEPMTQEFSTLCSTILSYLNFIYLELFNKKVSNLPKHGKKIIKWRK